ncbi:MAG: dihydrodipicolinate synthase family protein [Calditrichaeota bacterium]|nr:dihydrodipicolinate synthase family protein [Calditrichota bacterium]
MKKQKKYRGVVVPMVTPITEKGKIDEAALERLVEHIVGAGTSPFIMGTTGESPLISPEIKIEMAKKVVHHVKNRTLVYAGISENCLAISIDLARRFLDLGVDVCVSHLPYYYEIPPEQMLRYYESLAERIPGPIMLYNIPLTTHMSIPLKIVEELSHHPRIIGLKDSERDEVRLVQASEQWRDRDDFSIMCGWLARGAEALALGWDGLVPSSGNIVPELFQQMYLAAQQGNIKQAEEIQKKTDAISRIYQKNRLLSHSLAGLKAMMNFMGLCQKNVFSPLKEINSTAEEDIRLEMKSLGLI